MESNRGGLGRKLLPKAITAKRLRRKHSKDIDGETTASDDAITLDFGPVPPAAAPSLHGHASDNSLHATATTASDSTDTNSTGANGNMAHRNESSSLVSYDSDPDLSARPHTLSTHPSQIGYLTTSSPLVQDAHLKDLPAAKQADSAPRSATFQVSTNDSSESLPGISTAKTGLLQLRSGSSSTRSRSPVGRFRDVFRSNKTASNASTSPDRRSETSDREHRERDIPTDLKPTTTVPPLKPTAKPAAPAGPTEPTETAGRPKTAPGRPRGQSKSKIDISIVPPRTPPAGDKPPPVIVNTPPTPTESSNPLLQTSPTKNSTPDAAPPSGASSTGPSSGGIMQTRRVRAGSGSIGPSKLSNITLPPLSPTPENGPGGSSPAASGFFSSMISAAQNAANTLSNSISTANLAPQKGKTTAGKDKETNEEEITETQESQPSASNEPMEEKELAVKTLGQGDLSLSQLGLAETNSSAATPVVSNSSDPAAPRSRSDSAPVESEHASNVDTLVDDSQGLSRPFSLYEPGFPGDQTPPTASIYEGKSDIKRSGSIRSAIGGGQRGRQRGGSAATGTTIGAAIAAVNTSMANPSANASAHKLTGFAVASKKRNRDFHNLFKSVPDDDYLIEDYSCALQREILAHGRLYVSEGHLCFSSNIFGWVTTLVMSFDEIVSVEKRSTALVFKNGLMISTLHAKHIFASFTSRDSTYDLIVNIWKLGHPSLKSSLNGVSLDETGGDKTEKVDIEPPVEHQSPPESDEEESEDGSDVYDEDEDNDDTPETTQQTEISATNGDAEKPAARKVSGPAISAAGATEKPKETAAAATDTDFPGPSTHAPTDCGDTDTHYDKIMGDDVIPAPLGKVYSMLFGAQSPKWFVKWLTDDQKCTELQMEDKIGLSLENKTRNYTYIKPLNAPIGPKQTKCIVTEVLDNLDFDKSANITVTTQTPDVPSGNIFSVKTRYCLSWAENNATRVQMCCMIEWTGKSWLKGPIEKGTNDGQSQYARELFAGLKLAVSSRSRSGTQTGGSVPKGKKKGKKGKPAQAATPTTETEVLKNTTQSWGIFAPVQPFLGPVVDIVGPLLTGNLMYGLLVGLLVTTWFGFGFNDRQAGGGLYGGRDLSYVGHYPDRIAAYEEIWRREESELWDWLEERVALDRLGNGAEGLGVRRRAVEPRTVEEKLREERMDNREIREAIRVTEEKLKILKEVIDKRQGHGA